MAIAYFLLLLFNYYIIFHVKTVKPTFVPPCIQKKPLQLDKKDSNKIVTPTLTGWMNK